jgi:hypothetical protein
MFIFGQPFDFLRLQCCFCPKFICLYLCDCFMATMLSKYFVLVSWLSAHRWCSLFAVYMAVQFCVRGKTSTDLPASGIGIVLIVVQIRMSIFLIILCMRGTFILFKKRMPCINDSIPNDIKYHSSL